MLTEINKPRKVKEWRIKHDFKPTSYAYKGQHWTLTATIGSKVMMYISFTPTAMYIIYQPPWPSVRSHSIDEVPTIGEWTTIDIIHEELEPRWYTLTVLFGRRQVFREERAGTCDLNNAQINYAHGVSPGYVRNLSIMTYDNNDDEDDEDNEDIEDNDDNDFDDYVNDYDNDDNGDNDDNDNEHF